MNPLLKEAYDRSGEVCSNWAVMVRCGGCSSRSVLLSCVQPRYCCCFRRKIVCQNPILSWIALPSSFTIINFGAQKVVKNWQLFLCVGVGL
ncbi:hypothetical protein L1987_20988 [Smallanthus sonchifolius]|uniref:Uncharacterized protein n=1 Tax=Smallanthus sonchifolius TaxID=185202 RepID=A0ACB9ISR0_9ASTR|nr:hypothetical protein L1987_20988 [Smallanthus sonchifolius]